MNNVNILGKERKGEDRIHVAQERDKWRVLVNKALNFLVP